MKPPAACFSIKKKSYYSFLLTNVIPVALLILISPVLLSNSSHHHHSSKTKTPPVAVRPPPHSFIQSTCNNTLYPSLCFKTLSSVPIYPHHDNHTRTRNVLQFAIQKTISRVERSRSRMADLITLKVQENNWVENCLHLLDLTQLELKESMKYVSPSYMDPRPYGVIKNLLSISMTNENACIHGFSYLKIDDVTLTRLARYFRESLTPIMRMISNCLAITNHLEAIGSLKNTRLLS